MKKERFPINALECLRDSNIDLTRLGEKAGELPGSSKQLGGSGAGSASDSPALRCSDPMGLGEGVDVRSVSA